MSPLFRPDVPRVDHGFGPVQLTGRVQLRKQHTMQRIEDPRISPASQPPPTGHTRAEPQFLGQIFPPDTGEQHEQDPLKTLAVIDRDRATFARPTRWKQRLHHTPQSIIDNPRSSHPTIKPTPPPALTVNPTHKPVRSSKRSSSPRRTIRTAGSHHTNSKSLSKLS